MSRVRRSFFTFGSNLAFTAVTLCASLVATPILIRVLGRARFGAFRTLFDWFAAFQLLELGLGWAILSLLAQAQAQEAQGEPGRVRRVMAAALRGYSRVTLLQAAAGIALIAAAPRLIPVPSPLHGDLRRAACLLLGSTLLQTLLMPYRSRLDAAQRGYVINAVMIVNGLLVIGLSVLLARAGWGISSQAIATLAATAVSMAIMAGPALRRDPRAVVEAMTRPVDRELRGRMRRLNTASLLCRATNHISMYCDRLIVSAFLGAATVTPMYATQRLVELAMGQLQAIGSSSWAALADLYQRGEHERFRRRVVDLTGLIAVLSAAVLVPIGVFGGHFVSIWVDPDQFAGRAFLTVAAANAFLLSLVCFWNFCFAGTGQMERLVPMAFVAMLVNLAISFGTIRRLGVLGPALGTFGGLAGVNLWCFPWILRATFGIPIRSIFSALARPAALALPYAVGLMALARAHPPRGWTALALEMGIPVPLYLLAAWFVVLDPEQRGELARRLPVLRRLRLA